MLYRSNRLRTACPHSPTHPRSQPNYLDHIYVSEPCYSVVEVVCSTIKSDHRAVIASASNTNITYLHKVKTQHQYRKCTPDQHAALLSYLSTFSWDTVYQQTDTQSAFDVFYGFTLDILNRFYPLQTITITNRDPHFITPHIKALLKHRNRLMRRGAVAAADSTL